MRSNIAAFRKFATYLTSTIRRWAVQTLVLYHLDYCSVIWASAPKGIAQNWADRCIETVKSESNVDQMYPRFRWPKVFNRLSISILLFMRNIIDIEYPTALFNQIKFVSRCSSVQNQNQLL